MKNAMNGCLLLAARGGSNDEIQGEIGDENIVNLFSFLATRTAELQSDNSVSSCRVGCFVAALRLLVFDILMDYGILTKKCIRATDILWCSLQFMFGGKADEIGEFRSERRKFNPPRDFHRVIGYLLF